MAEPRRFVVLIALLAALALAGCSSTDSSYWDLIQQEGTAAKAAVDWVHARYYSSGAWAFQPGDYTAAPDGNWEVDEGPAVLEAVLACVPSGLNADTASEAQTARDTVNRAILQHQLPSGEFDAGPPGSVPSTVVYGTFWAQVQGTVAYILDMCGQLDHATLVSWEQSLGRYVNWLESSDNASWYSNGNNNLRMALVLTEEAKLANAAGEPSSIVWGYIADAEDEKNFVDNPGWQPPPNGPGFGWNQTGAAGYFSETPDGTDTDDWWCNNSGPCTGFDPSYTSLQLQTALWGYVVSGYDSWWQNVVTDEYNELAPLLSNGQLNMLNGSRVNASPSTFWTDVYSVLDEHNLGQHDADWRAQQNQWGNFYTWLEQPANQNRPSFANTTFWDVAAAAPGLFDVELRH